MDAELLDDTILIHDPLLPPVVGDDAVCNDDLGHVLVRAADDDLLDIFDPADGRRGEGVIGLELDVPPHDDANGFERLFGEGELSQQLLFHAHRRFVAGEHDVAK
jgi:hypothetical protein